MLKIFPKYLNFENISKKCIRVPGPLVKEITNDLIMASKRVNIDSTSSA